MKQEELLKDNNMNKSEINERIPVKVEDIAGKLDDYVTLEDFMKRTAYTDEGIISQEEIYQNEWLTIDEAKDETIESIRQIYESDDY